MGQYNVAGLKTQISLPVPLVQDILPTSQVNQRPGIPLKKPHYWVQHETANTNRGANAAMHSRWLRNGADGQTLSFHFCVDDREIRQFLPVNEVSWQAADGSGPGNMNSVSCELCVNIDGNKTLARRNAEALAGAICAAMNIPPSSVRRHWDFNAGDPGRHYCPEQMMREGYWPTFINNVSSIIGAKPQTTYPKAKAVADGDQSVNGRMFISAPRSATVVNAVTPRQYADPAASATGPVIPSGKVLDVTHVCVGSDSSPWFVLRSGDRVPAASCIK